MSELKIVKFGNIREDNDGDIVIEHFHFEGDSDSSIKDILKCVIDRLEEELDALTVKKNCFEDIS